MMRGPIVHGVLLVAAMGLAYQSWTREKTVERKTGNVEVWAKKLDQVQKVVYETKNRTVSLERRTDELGAYFWGTETRVTEVKKPRKPGEKPPEDPPETKTTVRSFPVGERGETAIENLADLRALRDLGEVDDTDKEKYELVESTDTVTVVFADGERALLLGGRIYGGSDRYVLDTQTGKAYAVAGSLISPLHSGETGLNPKNIHAFDKDDVAGVHIAAHVAGDKELSLVRTETETEHGKKKGWADARTPDKPDQTIANLLNRLETGVRPSQYYETVDHPEALQKLATVTYKDKAGTSLGTFELYKTEVMPEPAPEPETPPAGEEGKDADKDAADPDKAEGKDAEADKKAEDKDAEADDKAEGEDAEADKKAEEPKKPEPEVTFYVKTERTRIYGKIGKSLGNLIERDMTQLFAE